MGGGGSLSAPPFFKGQIVKKNLKCQKSEKFLSLFLDLFFVLYIVLQFLSNHLVCLQNAFEKTYPESRSPKGSCHILCWLEVYILQNNIMPGRLWGWELPTSWHECNRPVVLTWMASWPPCHIVNST